MVAKIHRYRVTVTWTGNSGQGTAGYWSYNRNHMVTASEADEGQQPGGYGVPPPIAGSSEPAFRGDPECWNPEQLLTGALSQCHMLWYLHLCAAAGVVTTGYSDDAVGTMAEDADGGGRFTEVVLRPHVTVSSRDMIAKAAGLHRDAHEKCFIARSVAFPVRHEPWVTAPSGS